GETNGDEPGHAHTSTSPSIGELDPDQETKEAVTRVTASCHRAPAPSYCLRSSLMSTATSCDTQLVSFQPSPTLKSKRLIVMLPANFAVAPAPCSVNFSAIGFVVPFSVRLPFATYEPSAAFSIFCDSNFASGYCFALNQSLSS